MPATNPLLQRFFSSTPYALGARYVKYSAVPIDCRDRRVLHDAAANPPTRDPNYLRAAMGRTLATGGATASGANGSAVSTIPINPWVRQPIQRSPSGELAERTAQRARGDERLAVDELGRVDEPPGGQPGPHRLQVEGVLGAHRRAVGHPAH